MEHVYACPACGHEVASDEEPSRVDGWVGWHSFIWCQTHGGCTYHGRFALVEWGCAPPVDSLPASQLRVRLSALAQRAAVAAAG